MRHPWIALDIQTAPWEGAHDPGGWREAALAKHKLTEEDLEELSEEALRAKAMAEVKVGNLKDPAKIAAKVTAKEVEICAKCRHDIHKVEETTAQLHRQWLDRRQLHPFTGEVYCLGVALGASAEAISHNVHFADENNGEAALLSKAHQYIEGADLVFGHNILNFDLPFLAWRMVRVSIGLPRPMGSTPAGFFCGNFQDSLNIMKRQFGDTKGFGKLDEVCRFLGLSLKPRPEGEETSANFAKWDRDAQRKYQLHNLEVTVEIGKRLGVLG